MKKFMVIAALAAMMIACASKEEKLTNDAVKALEAKDAKAYWDLMQNNAGVQLSAEQTKKIEDAYNEAIKDEKFQEEYTKLAREAAKQVQGAADAAGAAAGAAGMDMEF